MRTFLALLSACLACAASLSSNATAAVAVRRDEGYGYGMETFDDFIARELGSRLRGDVYLDYAASGLYTNTQIDDIAADLKSNLYGNPHSLSPSAMLSSAAVERARTEILAFFGASSTEYEVVFTRSCTDSLRLVADLFPWQANGSEFKYLLQNHNSVLGIRDVARSHLAFAGAIQSDQVDAWLEDLASTPHSPDEPPLSLFAYPAEENFAGRRFPLQWAERIASRTGSLRKWRVLLDAAKFVASHPLNLTEVPADFVTLSFYKIFGFPTGVGALIVKQDVATELQKGYWGGGTVTVAGAGRTKEEDVRVFKSRASERFEDGTVAFLGIAALTHGFAALQRVGGMEAIEKHTSLLATRLHDMLLALRHTNGNPIVVLYSMRPMSADGEVASTQGPIVNFNLLRADGSLVSYIDVVSAAAEAGVHVRGGAHCNPGAASSALGLSPEVIASMAEDSSMGGCGVGPAFVKSRASEMGSDQLSSCLASGDRDVSGSGGQLPDFLRRPKDTYVHIPLGSIRASVGYLSTDDDVRALVSFIGRQYLE